MTEVSKPEHDIDRWERELREAGWKNYEYRGRIKRYIWVAPNGALYRGPYAAWQMMKSLEQWGGQP